MARPRMVEVLYFDGCPSYEALLPRLRQLIGVAGQDGDIQLRRLDGPESAEREQFLGSPTVRVDGVDVEPGASERRDYGMKCRLYRLNDDLFPIPPEAWIRSALEGRS